jgi:hypothetical protein
VKLGTSFIARGTATTALTATAMAASYVAICSMLVAPIGAGILDLGDVKRKKPPGFGGYYYETVAWGMSKGPCAGTQYLSSKSRNPCGLPFSIGGCSDLKFKGCGGPGLWVNQNSQWAANCFSTATGEVCSVTGEWYCCS